MSGLTEAQVKRAIVQMVADAKKQLLIVEPVEYEEAKYKIMTHMGIHVSEMDLENDDGVYSPLPTPSIGINPIMSRERLLFTLFHELTHHLIKNNDEIYSFIHEHASSDDDTFHAVLEYYCNIGAAEFIIPSSKVIQAISEKGFIISLIKDLDEQYPASKPAIAAQLVACANHKCFILICEHGIPPKKPRSEPLFDNSFATTSQCLYVQYAMASAEVPYRISRYATFPKGHLLYEAYTGKTTVNAKAHMPFRNSKYPTPCEAFYYKGKIYAIFNMSPPPTPISKDQMAMDLPS